MKTNPYRPSDRAFARKEEGTNIEQREAKADVSRERAELEREAASRTPQDYIRDAEETPARDKEEEEE